MCADYRRTKGYAQIADEFSHIRVPLIFPPPHEAPNLAPQYEARPTVPAVVLRQRDAGVELAHLRWGLIPFFHRGPFKSWKCATFNARTEAVKRTPSSRVPFKRRRCLVAADG